MKLELTPIDKARLSLIDVDDPGIQLACLEARERALGAWEMWKLTHKTDGSTDVSVGWISCSASG